MIIQKMAAALRNSRHKREKLARFLRRRELSKIIHPNWNCCPRCGSAVLEMRSKGGSSGPMTDYRIRCFYCGTTTEWESYTIDAVRLWNSIDPEKVRKEC